MPHDLYAWQRRIKAVEREHSGVWLAANHLLETASRDPTVLRGDVTHRDLVHATENLEGTYIIRLFAEFEAGLRLFWQTARGTNPPRRTQDLLNGVAATRRISHDELVNAHSVREYRNKLVHEREESMPPISISEARSHLCKFFRFLPPTW